MHRAPERGSVLHRSSLTVGRVTEEAVARIVLFVVMAGTGVLLLWMASAAASGRLKRNHIAGIRTPSTMTSDAAWLAAHQRALRPTRVAGLISLVTALSTLLPTSENVLFAGLMMGSALILVFVVHGAVVGGRAAREAEAD